MPPDEALVGRAQGGDRGALEALIRRHQRAAYRLCLRYVRDHDEAADLVQRTFVRAMDGLAVLRTAESFRSWVLRIAANLALNHVRDQAKFVRADDAGSAPRADLPVVLADAGAGIEADEDARALRQAVAALPTKQRQTLELRVHEELSFRDIAEALGTTEGAAKVNFHYAVRNLRQRMTAVAGHAGQKKRRGS